MKKILVLMLIAVMALLCSSSTASAGVLGLWKSDFRTIAKDGQGDWKNIYSWSMASFKGDLYVGTARQAAIAPVMEVITSAMPGMQLPPEAFPSDAVPFFREFLSITPGSPAPTVTDEAKFEQWNAGSQAEIWRLHDGVWSQVYRVPRVPAAMLAPGGVPPAAPYMTPLAVGFRYMTPFTDRNGVQALYASAGSFSFAHPDFARLLFMSVDGKNWVPLRTPDGMGRETRTMGVHNGKLYVGAGTATVSALGGVPTPGSVWCSNDPSDPASWKEVLHFPAVAPANTGVCSMTSANRRVYIGTENAGGFEVWRSTRADPTCNAHWKRLVKDGAGDRYNAWAGTMEAFRNNVYVGSMAVPGLTGAMAMKAFDLIRIKPDDRWQLLVGDRNPEIPVAGAAPRRPLTGLPSGFGMPTNLYCWTMEVYDGWLYVGSMDMSSMLRVATDAGMELPDSMGIPPTILELVLRAAGFDMWKTSEGLLWMPVTLTGMGDFHNYGVRTIAKHDGKLYIGTANPFRGFQVMEGFDR
jgi:hypothetical protein